MTDQGPATRRTGGAAEPPGGGGEALPDARPVVRSLARQDLSLPRLAGWTAAALAFAAGWLVTGLGVGPNTFGSAAESAAAAATGLPVLVGSLAAAIWLARPARRDLALLRGWVAAGRPGAGDYRVGVRGPLWGALSLSGLLTGLALLAAGVSGAGASAAPACDLGIGAVWTGCAAGGTVKVFRRWRLSVASRRIDEAGRTRRLDARAVDELTAAGLEFTPDALTALRGPDGTRRRRQLHRLATGDPGTPETYGRWDEWVTVLVTLLVCFAGAVGHPRGLLHGGLAIPVRLLLGAGCWLALLLCYFLPFRVGYLRSRRALLTAAAAAGSPADDRDAAVPASWDGRRGLLVHEAGRLVLRTAAGQDRVVPLAGVRAVFQLVPPNRPWPLPGMDLLLDDGTWSGISALGVEPLLDACESAGLRVFRAVRA